MVITKRFIYSGGDGTNVMILHILGRYDMEGDVWYLGEWSKPLGCAQDFHIWPVEPHEAKLVVQPTHL